MKPFGLLLFALFLMASCSSSKSTAAADKSEPELSKAEKRVNNKMDKFADLTAYLRTQRSLLISGDGQNANIAVRGLSTLGSNAPLFIVNNNQVRDYSTVFSLVNVQDIKTVRILKDASETSFYGSRGANGVILIKTKKKGS